LSAAVRYGYADLAALRSDDAFDDIRGEPRFEEAFVPSPSHFDLADLEQSLIVRGKPRSVLKPVLGMFFYSGEPLEKTGPRIAAALERYCELAPDVSHYKRGYWKPISKGHVTKEKNALKKAKMLYELSLRGSDGDASEESIQVRHEGHDMRVAMVFPRTLAPDEAYARFVEMANLLAFDVGMAGFTMQQRDNCNVYEGVSWDAGPANARCIGLVRGRVFEPAWLTFVSSSLAKTIGDTGEARREDVDHGIVLRASSRPPIGVSTSPTDVGALPSVMAALASLVRAPDERWNNVKATPYDNG
jgi:hypothetical protein